MAEITQYSRSAGRIGWLAGFFRAVVGRRPRSGHRMPRADLETWPDYLLRDVGLPASARREERRSPMEWPLR